MNKPSAPGYRNVEVTATGSSLSPMTEKDLESSLWDIIKDWNEFEDKNEVCYDEEEEE